MFHYDFAPEVRLALDRARDEAASRGRSRVDAEHILLGLVKNAGPVCDSVLTEVGIDPDALYREIDAVSQRGEGAPENMADIEFTPAAKEVLQLAVEEAPELGHDHIGNEHLLLGVLRSGSKPVAGALADAGLSNPRTREALVRIKPSKPGPPAEPTGRHALLISLIALAVALTALALVVTAHPVP